ncbi:FkbM family methyltransferase [Allosaccharopolyspora coralli]|uniref:FkbM family methyltransferase n=1 Tax=Allosaccharopolyspora coralli TaxID=2665642 RepID=A0A5Q3QFE3_9PSEU|nr:FkbM family methyltransferase [Allosaccharopolyspora coralli]
MRTAASVRLVEPEVLGLRRFVRPGDVCFDIGAAYGMYSYSLADLVGPTGVVHSFEPQFKSHFLLRAGKNVAGAQHMTVDRAGVGREQGTFDILLPVKFGLPIHGHAHLADGVTTQHGKSVKSGKFCWTRTIAVPVTTVDKVCADRGIERVDFMKIDVEGFEPSVVQGASSTIERDRPTLLLEIEDRHLSRYDQTAAEFSRMLRDLGYSMHVWKDGDWVPADEVTTDRRNYLFATERTWRRPAV